MEFSMRAIGVIHTPYLDKVDMPIQSSRSDTVGTIEVYPQFQEGLDGIEEFTRLYLVYIFHKADRFSSLKVKPFLDDLNHGLFTTRYPVRPNPIGFSVVQLIARENNVLHFKGADMLDGTPLLDIKPYIPDFDVFDAQKTGWYGNRNPRNAVITTGPNDK